MPLTRGLFWRQKSIDFRKILRYPYKSLSQTYARKNYPQCRFCFNVGIYAVYGGPFRYGGHTGSGIAFGAIRQWKIPKKYQPWRERLVLCPVARRYEEFYHRVSKCLI